MSSFAQVVGAVVRSVDPEEARRQAAEILSGSEFRESPPNWLERILRWIADRLPSGGGGANANGPGLLGNIVTLILLAAVITAAVVLVRYLVTHWRPRLPTAAARSAEVALSSRRNTAEWDALAGRLESEGRWREALRAVHAGMLARLVEVGLLEELVGRTAREYSADLIERIGESGRAAAMREATDLFEAAWYGGAEVGPGDLAHLRTLRAVVVGASPEVPV